MKSPLVDAVRRVAEFRRVGDVGGFHAPRCGGLRSAERSEHRQVEVPAARAAELIRPGVPKRTPGLCPRRRIDVVAGCANVADLLHRRDEIGRLQVAGRIQLVPSAVTVNGEPLNAPKSPLSCQSLISMRAMPPPLFSLRQGS